MNKTELIAAAAEEAGISKKDGQRFLDAVLAVLSDELIAGERIQLSGFGTFETRLRKARMGRNPATNEPMEIPAAQQVVFKVCKNLQDAVKE